MPVLPDVAIIHRIANQRTNATACRVHVYRFQAGCQFAIATVYAYLSAVEDLAAGWRHQGIRSKSDALERQA
jgi:hypothetical protein